MSCAVCGGELQEVPRLARWLPTPLLFVLPGVAAALAWFTTRIVPVTAGSAGVVFAAVMVLTNTERGQRYYWGGTQCESCGRFEMLR